MDAPDHRSGYASRQMQEPILLLFMPKRAYGEIPSDADAQGDWRRVAGYYRPQFSRQSGWALPTMGGNCESGGVIAGAYLVYSVVTDLAIWGTAVYYWWNGGF